MSKVGATRVLGVLSMRQNAELKQAVFTEVEGSWSSQVSFLKELIRCRSVFFHESGVQRVISRMMSALSISIDRFEIDTSKIYDKEGFSPVDWGYSNRPQLVGLWKTRNAAPGPSLTLNGHMDVVSAEPVDHWTRNPWEGIVEGQRMYGRGAADMKAGISAILFAISALRRCRVELSGDVILQFVIEEECSGNGTLACLERGYVADAAIIPESTNEQIMLAELGVLWLKTKVFGQAGHVEGSEAAVNAIEKSFQVIELLKELEKEWNGQSHPSFATENHPINFNTGIIRGGDWPSTVPATCEFHTRLSFYPGRKPSQVKKEVTSYLCDRLNGDDWFRSHPPAFTWFGHHDEGVVLDKENELIRKVKEIHEGLSGKDVTYKKIAACTDARFWPLYYRKPATCYGPIGANMHAADEYVDLPSVLHVTKVVAALIMDWCGVRSDSATY